LLCLSAQSVVFLGLKILFIFLLRGLSCELCDGYLVFDCGFECLAGSFLHVLATGWTLVL
jgi:hypothetical protein